MKIRTPKFRHIGLLAAFIILAGSIQAQSNLDALFNKLAENKKTTLVTISKDMMGLLATKVGETFDDGMSDTERLQMHKMGVTDTIKSLSEQIGSMRVISSKEFSLNEQAKYDKIIMEYLNDGYKDLMNISSGEDDNQPHYFTGNNGAKYFIPENGDTTQADRADTVNFEDRVKPITARMCVKPMVKDPTSKYDKISEFIIYVRQKNELSLIAIEGNIYTFKILTLTKLANLKGILKQTMEVNGL